MSWFHQYKLTTSHLAPALAFVIIIIVAALPTANLTLPLRLFVPDNSRLTDRLVKQFRERMSKPGQ